MDHMKTWMQLRVDLTGLVFGLSRYAIRGPSKASRYWLSITLWMWTIVTIVADLGILKLILDKVLVSTLSRLGRNQCLTFCSYPFSLPHLISRRFCFFLALVYFPSPIAEYLLTARRLICRLFWSRPWCLSFNSPVCMSVSHQPKEDSSLSCSYSCPCPVVRERDRSKWHTMLSIFTTYLYATIRRGGCPSSPSSWHLIVCLCFTLTYLNDKESQMITHWTTSFLFPLPLLLSQKYCSILTVCVSARFGQALDFWRIFNKQNVNRESGMWWIHSAELNGNSRGFYLTICLHTLLPICSRHAYRLCVLLVLSFDLNDGTDRRDVYRYLPHTHNMVIIGNQNPPETYWMYKHSTSRQMQRLQVITCAKWCKTG